MSYGYGSMLTVVIITIILIYQLGLLTVATEPGFQGPEDGGLLWSWA